MNIFNKIKNFFLLGNANSYPTILDGAKTKKNLGKTIVPLQLQRIKQDTENWRLAIEEAERAYNPFRVKMQQLYNDTILNGHVLACIESRKDLTMLREFDFVDSKGKVIEDINKLLKEKWLYDFISYSLDALFFGYTLVSLGDIEDSKFKEISIIKRWFVSPDRKVVSPMLYSIGGEDFTNDEYKDWHIFVKTDNNIGTSDCGYGLLYNIGIYEIFLRNILGYNGDFVELFSQPLRVGKTMKTEEDERAEFFNMLLQIGSSNVAMMDPNDEIEFVESKNAGTGWQGYENLEKRLEAKISKLILGHADALDSTAGKLGATEGEDSPTFLAKKAKKAKDGVFMENIINTELLPRLQKLGFNIPLGCKFVFRNDDETVENNNRLTALAVEMKKAGLQIDKDFYQDKTGIICSQETETIETPAVKIQNKLKNIYG